MVAKLCNGLVSDVHCTVFYFRMWQVSKMRGKYIYLDTMLASDYILLT